LAALFSGVQIAHMSDNLDGLDRWENAFERRSIGRTKILKAALLFFSGKPGVQSCIVRREVQRHDLQILGDRSPSVQAIGGKRRFQEM
jgi:hypothetical protein